MGRLLFRYLVRHRNRNLGADGKEIFRFQPVKLCENSKNTALQSRNDQESQMTRLVIVTALFCIACLFAGSYGAIHNQISYTVAPEYFTEFKFHQFHINPKTPDRIGAAIVGWQAAWWMGIIIGGVLIPLGLLIRGDAKYFGAMIRAFGIVTLTTLVVGLTALLISYFTVSTETLAGRSRYGNEITNPVAFVRAGTMHNFSYLGGLAGIITAGITILRQFIRSEPMN